MSVLYLGLTWTHRLKLISPSMGWNRHSGPACRRISSCSVVRVSELEVVGGSRVRFSLGARNFSLSFLVSGFSFYQIILYSLGLLR